MKSNKAAASVPGGQPEDVVILTVMPDSFKPHCCGIYGEENLYYGCQKIGVEFCPADYYSGDPENPFLATEGAPVFKVRIAKCEGLID